MKYFLFKILYLSIFNLLFSCGNKGTITTLNTGTVTTSKTITFSNIPQKQIPPEVLATEKKAQITSSGFTDSSDTVLVVTQDKLITIYKTIEEFYKLAILSQTSFNLTIPTKLQTQIDNLNLKTFYIVNSNATYVGLEEKSPQLYGYGFFLIRMDSDQSGPKLLIEIPHPIHDSNTADFGGEVLKEMGVSYYIQSGTHRNNSSLETTDTIPGNKTSSTTYSKTDPAHNSSGFFHIAHLILSKNIDYVIQLHGYATATYPGVEVILSGGTRSSYPPILDNLKTQFLSESIAASIYPKDILSLGAQANVQGHHVRSQLGNKFIHIESHTGLRVDTTQRARMIKVLKNVFQ